MLALSQKNPAWKDIKLGTCNDTIGESGCFITALGILADKTPPEVNDLLKNNGGYANAYKKGVCVGKCNVIPSRAAELLGLEYNGITKEYQNQVCIAETDHYKSSGVPQHFFVWLGRASRIIDTLSGLEMDNPYHIVSFRLFKPKGTIMDCFASRDMVVGKIKELLDYWYLKLYVAGDTATSPTPIPNTQKMAESIADDNINLVGFVKEEVKTDFFKYFIRKLDMGKEIERLKNVYNNLVIDKNIEIGELNTTILNKDTEIKRLKDATCKQNTFWDLLVLLYHKFKFWSERTKIE